jgi:hypothetical protein
MQLSDDLVLISSLVVDTEQPEENSLHQILSPSSASPAASADPSDDPLNDIFSRLL